MTDAGILPLLRVVRGDATAEETAALVAVLVLARAAAARQARADAGRGQANGHARSGWSDKSRLSQRPLPHGPGGWRASALPR